MLLPVLGMAVLILFPLLFVVLRVSPLLLRVGLLPLRLLLMGLPLRRSRGGALALG